MNINEYLEISIKYNNALLIADCNYNIDDARFLTIDLREVESVGDLKTLIGVTMRNRIIDDILNFTVNHEIIVLDIRHCKSSYMDELIDWLSTTDYRYMILTRFLKNISLDYIKYGHATLCRVHIAAKYINDDLCIIKDRLGIF